MKGQGVSRDALNNFKSTLSVAYIIIPDNFKGEGRVNFIQNCYRRERVSVMYEGGGLVKHDCFITTEALYNIKFPEKTISEDLSKGSTVSRLGSMVIVLGEPYHDQTFVVGTVSKLDDSNMFQESEFKVVRGKDGSVALISIDGISGNVNITTFGASTGGDFNINIANQSNGAKLNLGVRGDININVTGNVNLTSAGDVNVKPSKLNIGEENLEPITKGDKAETELNKEKKALTDFLDAVKNLTPTPVPLNAIDPTWTTLKTAIAVITDRADYSQIKSGKTFSE